MAKMTEQQEKKWDERMKELRQLDKEQLQQLFFKATGLNPDRVRWNENAVIDEILKWEFRNN